MAADATLHHLLTHTSGIGDYAGEDEDLDNYVEDYGSLWADRPSYRMQRPLDYLPMYGSFPPIMKPGSGSNTAMPATSCSAKYRRR